MLILLLTLLLTKNKFNNNNCINQIIYLIKSKDYFVKAFSLKRIILFTPNHNLLKHNKFYL